MKTLSSTLRGGLNIYINKRLIASVHNNVTASFIISLVRAIFGTSSIYSGYFEMPSTAVVKLTYENTPVTTSIMSHVAFTEETVAGLEHTRIIYSFSDASRTKYSFDSLELWSASTHSLLAQISNAVLDTPLRKNPEDVIQIDWWVEMISGQPFSNMLTYLKQQQAKNCPSTCDLNLVLPNLTYGYSVFNIYFSLLALPNIINVSKDIKTPLTSFFNQRLTQASNVEPQGITNIICYDICNCQVKNTEASGFVSESVDNKYVYVAYNFNNPCLPGQYVIPITTLSLGNNYIAQFAVAPVPSPGIGKSAFVIKVPYGELTLNNLFTHQGE